MNIENWRETALLTLVDSSNNKMNFALITESFDFKPGDKDIDPVPMVNGGRIVKFNPEGPFEFSGKIVPLGAGTTAASIEGFWQHMHPQGTPKGAGAIQVFNTRRRNVYDVAIMMTSGTYPADATAASPAAADSQRVAVRNAYITAEPYSFSTSDGWMADITIKGAPFTKAGASNISFESTDAASTAIAILSWTNATNP